MVSLAVIDNDWFDEMESLPDLEFVSDSGVDKTDLLESYDKDYITSFIHPFPHNDSDTSSDGPPSFLFTS